MAVATVVLLTVVVATVVVLAVVVVVATAVEAPQQRPPSPLVLAAATCGRWGVGDGESEQGTATAGDGCAAPARPPSGAPARLEAEKGRKRQAEGGGGGKPMPRRAVAALPATATVTAKGEAPCRSVFCGRGARQRGRYPVQRLPLGGSPRDAGRAVGRGGQQHLGAAADGQWFLQEAAVAPTHTQPLGGSFKEAVGSTTAAQWRPIRPTQKQYVGEGDGGGGRTVATPPRQNVVVWTDGIGGSSHSEIAGASCSLYLCSRRHWNSGMHQRLVG